MSEITDIMGLTDNGNGTFSDPSQPGLLFNDMGNQVDESTGSTTETPVTPSTSTGFGGSGTDPAVASPPPGAVAKSADGKSWLDNLGQYIGPVVASLVTPYLNNAQSAGLLNSGTGILQRAAGSLDNVGAPDLTQLIPQLRLQIMQGSMSPAQAAAAYQEASRMGDVKTDHTSLEGQRAALAQLAQIGSNNGMTEADRAALNATMNQTNANAAQQRAAQIQQLQMQGNAGTGAELAARLSGVQGGANSNAAAGASTAQAAQMRALQAIQSGLQGNANLNTQQFEQEARKVAAQDAVNSFNAQAQQQTNLANAGWQQQAAANNFNTANDIAKTNTGIQNTQAMMPLDTTQKNFTNQLDLGKTRGALGIASGKPLVDAATAQIVRSNNAMGATGAGNVNNQASGGGKSVDPITGAIKDVVGNVVKDGLGGVLSKVGDGLGDVVSTVGGWLGFKDGGYVNVPKPNAVSDQDIDSLIAHMTQYKYRKNKGQ